MTDTAEALASTGNQLKIVDLTEKSNILTEKS
jgi:hypothetical protein